MTDSQPYPEIDRIDGVAKVTGAARFGADRHPEGMLFAAFVVSSTARGTITELDTAAAESMPGVRLVLTHRNVERIQSVGYLLAGGFAYQSVQPLLSDQVHHRGQIVAVVVADSLERADDAALSVSHFVAPEDFDASLWQSTSTPVAQGKTPLADMFPDVEIGDDAEGAFARAAVKVDRTFRTEPQHQNPMELVGGVVEWVGDRLIVHEGTQHSGGLKNGLAVQLGIDAGLIDVISPYAGGGFGQKNSLQVHTALIAIAARRLDAPVKAVRPRSQLFHDASFRPASVHHVRLGADEAGSFASMLYDVDAQTSRHDMFPADYVNVAARLHDFKNVLARQRLVSVDTQTPGYMRSPFEHMAAFATECAVDEIAYLLDTDPIDLRIANEPDRDPITGKPFSSRFLVECLKTGAEMFGWRDRTMAPGSMGTEDGELVGWGVAVGAYKASAAAAVGWLSVDASGAVTASVGVHEMGQGVRTALVNQLVRRLGVAPSAIELRLGDTTGAPQHLTAGSWGTATAAPALDRACDALVEELHALGTGQVPEATPAEILTRAGRDELHVKTPSLAPGQPEQVIERLEGGLPAAGGPEYPDFVSFSHAAHFAEVRVEPSTGRIRVPRFVSVVDCGRVLSPRTARSQVIGGVVWGIGAALREVSESDLGRGGFLNTNIADYVIPVNADVGSIDVAFVDQPDPQLNSIGVKGLGEVALAGVAPAIANAIHHATGRRFTRLPIRLDDLLTPQD